MKTILYLIIILLIAVNISAINHMDLLFMMEGAQLYGDFGASLASLDFNGDGHDDLAVLQQSWVPDSLFSDPLPINLRWGRILFYYGGPGFDSTPDFVIEGTHNAQFYYGYNPLIVNVGDVNGDGCEDLGTLGRGTQAENIKPCISVYFGGQNPSHEPGYRNVFNYPHSNSAEIDPLGDINQDGFDDFSYVYLSNSSYDDLNRSALILGGSDTLTEHIWRQYDSDDRMSFSPAGDANNDVYDDYVVYYSQRISDGVSLRLNTLYFGTENAVPADSVLLYSSQTNRVWRAKYLGDLNGDGVDDFTGLIEYINPGIRVWYGNETLTNQYDLTLTPNWAGDGNNDRGLVHGDLNHDGYDDVAGSDPLEYGRRGAFRIWMGGTNMNGTSDLTVGDVTMPYLMLGTGMAAGDFNADGFCDVAASAPHMSNYNFFPGQVYIYTGNAQLADTTVSNEDPNAGQLSPNWSFSVVPNPIRGRQVWKLKFTGKGYDRYRDMTVKIYNSKGQKVKTLRVTGAQAKAGEVILPDLHLPGGVYEVSLYEKGKLLQTKKATFK